MQLEVRQKLSRPCAFPLEFSGIIHNLFDSCYCPKDMYRATGVVLLDLEPDNTVQYFFDNALQAEKIRSLYNVADELGQKIW